MTFFPARHLGQDIWFRYLDPSCLTQGVALDRNSFLGDTENDIWPKPNWLHPLVGISGTWCGVGFARGSDSDLNPDFLLSGMIPGPTDHRFHHGLGSRSFSVSNNFAQKWVWVQRDTWVNISGSDILTQVSRWTETDGFGPGLILYWSMGIDWP